MKNLFVGNMSFQTTESNLRALFEPFGQITRIHIVQDRETGQPRGFAFVEMAADTGAAKAMTDLNGKEVSGRARQTPCSISSKSARNVSPLLFGRNLAVMHGAV